MSLPTPDMRAWTTDNRYGSCARKSTSPRCTEAGALIWVPQSIRTKGSYFPSKCLKPSSGPCSPSTFKTPPSSHTLHHLPIQQLLKPKDYAFYNRKIMQFFLLRIFRAVYRVKKKHKARGPPHTTSHYVKHRPVGSVRRRRNVIGRKTTEPN
jgi:hypothetical protein